MFCRFCGKEIKDVKYCPYCGKSVDKASFDLGTVKKAVKIIQKYLLAVGYNKLFMLTAIIGTVINFIIRICCNEVTTVHVALAQDDYYRLSGAGRVWSIIFILIQILICAALVYFTKKKDDHLSQLDSTGTEFEIIEKKTYIVVGILLAIQIVMMLISIPAPY